MGGSQFRESPIFFFSSPFSSIFSLKPWKLRGKVVSLHKKAALGKLKASFLCARLHFLCQRIAILRPRPDLIKRKQMANNIENQDKSKPVANCDQYICKLIFFSFISSIFHLNIWILKRKIVSLRHHLK